MPLGASRFGLLGGVEDLGKLELISTQSYSTAVGAVDFKATDGTFDTSYNVHLMTLNNVGMSTGNFNQPGVRFFESNVLESASVYEQARLDGFYNATTQQSRTTSISSINTLVDNGTTTTRSRNVFIYFFNLSSSSKYSYCVFQGSGIKGNTEVRYSFGIGMLPQASAVDGIRIFPANGGGNFSSFDMSLYGIESS